jgi:glycosyltransferase involved in cell wall biosynthesis
MRIKVLFLIPTLRGGGSERVMVTLLNHLDRSRFQLALGVVDMRGAVFRDDVPADVEIIDLNCSRVRYAIPKILGLVRSMRPRVVFSTLGHLNLALAVVKPLFPRGVRLIGRESIIVSRGLSSYKLPGLWAWGYRRFYPRLDRVVCQSRDMRDDLVELFAFPECRTTVINNPVDINRVRYLAKESIPAESDLFYTRNEAIHLVAAGRLDFQKGFDLLIEAVALCQDERLYVSLLGEGPLEEDLYRLSEEHGVAGQLRFLGFQKNPYPFFARADAFVLSSRYEGFPNVVIEALACGTPVIATPAPGGTCEILTSIPACELADAVTAPSLATAIRCWLARRPGRVGDEEVAPYQVAQIVRKYEEVILSVATP